MSTATSPMLASVPQDVLKQPSPASTEPNHPIAGIISATWSGPLPPPAELERFEQIVPGSAERLFELAEKELLSRIERAEKDQISRIERAEKNQASRIELAEKNQASRIERAHKEQDSRIETARNEQTHRFADTKRGLHLGWSLAMGALVTAAVISLCHAPWQVAVAVLGIPVLGAVQALIRGRQEK